MSEVVCQTPGNNSNKSKQH